MLDTSVKKKMLVCCTGLTLSIQIKSSSREDFTAFLKKFGFMLRFFSLQYFTNPLVEFNVDKSSNSLFSMASTKYNSFNFFLSNFYFT